MSLGKLQELVMDREALHAAVHGVTKSQTWLSDWTELKPAIPGVISLSSLSCSTTRPFALQSHPRHWCLFSCCCSHLACFPLKPLFMQILPAGFYSWTFKTSSLTLPALNNLFIDLHHAQNKSPWPLNPMVILFPALQLPQHSPHPSSAPDTLGSLPFPKPWCHFPPRALHLWSSSSGQCTQLMSPSCLLREAFSTTHLLCFCAPQLSILRLIHFLSKHLWLPEIILSI